MKSKSQYPGTLKDSICRICNENLNHLNATQQEEHAEKCLSQSRLWE